MRWGAWWLSVASLSTIFHGNWRCRWGGNAIILNILWTGSLIKCSIMFHLPPFLHLLIREGLVTFIKYWGGYRCLQFLQFGSTKIFLRFKMSWTVKQIFLQKLNRHVQQVLLTSKLDPFLKSAWNINWAQLNLLPPTINDRKIHWMKTQTMHWHRRILGNAEQGSSWWRGSLLIDAADDATSSMLFRGLWRHFKQNLSQNSQ